MPTWEIAILAVLGICFATDIAGAAIAVRLWRARSTGAPIKTKTAVYLVFTVVITVLAIGSVLHATWTVLRAVRDDVEPSQKARLLAEGISEAMNVAAFAIPVATPLALAVLIYAWLRRSRP